jgi:hypothetical protein
MPVDAGTVRSNSLPYLPQTTEFYNDVFTTVFCALLVGTATLVGLIVVRVLKKPQVEAITGTAIGVVVCLALMFWVRPWHPPSDLARQIVPTACLIVWMAVFIMAWASLRRDLRALGGALSVAKTDLTKLVEARPDHNSVGKMLRTQAGEIREALSVGLRTGAMPPAALSGSSTSEVFLPGGPLSCDGIGIVYPPTIVADLGTQRVRCECRVLFVGIKGAPRPSLLTLALTNTDGDLIANLEADPSTMNHDGLVYFADSVIDWHLRKGISKILGKQDTDWTPGDGKPKFIEVYVGLPKSGDALGAHLNSDVKFGFEMISGMRSQRFLIAVVERPDGRPTERVESDLESFVNSTKESYSK